MAKTFTFVLLVFILMVAGTVVSMAGGDGPELLDGFLRENSDMTDVNPETEGVSEEVSAQADMETYEGLETESVAVETEVEAEGYSTEKVLNQYRSLFCDREIQSELELVAMKVNHSGKGAAIQDYIITGTVTEVMELDYDDAMILMIFVEKDNGFEIYKEPEEASVCFQSKVELPFVGKNNPNRLRFITFPKNSYDNLELNVNLQITDMEVTIATPVTLLEKLKEKLLNTQDSLRYLENGK